MKKVFLFLAILSAVTFAGFSYAGESPQTDQPEKITLSNEVPISLYGFISAEVLWSESQLSTFGTNNNTVANYNKGIAGFNRVVDEATSPNNDAFINFTPQNTRLGFSLDPYDFNGKPFKVDGKIELDFFSTNELNAASIRPRIRRAYSAIGGEYWRVLAGYEWDVFSPLNPATLNIGGNMWRQGNLGFRRPQIAFSYSYPLVEEVTLESVASINLPSNSLSNDDLGNTTGVPMAEGRFGYIYKRSPGDIKLYISGAYARHKNEVAGAANVNNWGVSFSGEAPLHKFLIPSLEFGYGYSLGMMLSNASDTLRQRFISGWGQIKSNWLSWLETNVGYGYEVLENSMIATGWVKRNQMGFGNVMFKPVKAFVMGLEYNYLRTNYQGSGASHANVVFTNFLYYF